MKKHLVVICLLILVSLLIFGCRGEVRPNPLKRARELVAIGDSREKAIDLLGVEAWYHQPCKHMEGESIKDLFFYGSHGYDEARIVILGSVFDGAEYKVTSIGSFDDANPMAYLSTQTA